MSEVTDKEKLDIAWKYFQQHAQQRLNYFNFFIIFSGLMTNAYITTLEQKFSYPLIGVVIGLMQTFISYIFLKIDQRNKFLTKHSESVIIDIESGYKPSNDSIDSKQNKLFTNESSKTKEKKKTEFFLFRQFSHGDSFKLIYIAFILLGLTSSIWTYCYKEDPSVKTNNQEQIKIDTLKIEILKIDTIENKMILPNIRLETLVTKPELPPNK